MGKHVFKEDRRKRFAWWALLPLCGTPVAAWLWISWLDTQNSWTLLLLFCLAGGIILTCARLLRPGPALVIDGKGVEYKEIKIPFAEVDDIRAACPVYRFYTSAGRSMTLDLEAFSASDRRAIDGLMSQKLEKEFSRRAASGTLSPARKEEEYGLCFTETRSAVVSISLKMISIIVGVMALVFLILIFNLGVNETMQLTDPVALALMLLLWMILAWLGRIYPKSGLDYGEGVFTLTKGGRTKYRFTAEDVILVSADPHYKRQISFLLRGDKTATVYLQNYPEAERKILVGCIKTFFSLSGE